MSLSPRPIPAVLPQPRTTTVGSDTETPCSKGSSYKMSPQRSDDLSAELDSEISDAFMIFSVGVVETILTLYVVLDASKKVLL